MARRQGGLEAPDQKYISPDRKDNLNLPPWHSEGGGMEGSNSFRNPGVVGFRGGGGVHQGLGVRGGGLGGTSGYRAPSGIGGYGGGGFQGGQVGIYGAGVGPGAGGGGYQGEGGGGGFQAGAGFQTGGFGDPSSRIFTSPGRSKPPKNNSTLNK